MPFLQTYEDLAPCDKSKAVMKFMQKNRINVLDWHGSSPDSTPIEHLWSILKKHLGEKDCSMKECLITNIIKTWFHDNEGIKNIWSKPMKAMPKRVQGVSAAKGGHVSYYMVTPLIHSPMVRNAC